MSPIRALGATLGLVDGAWAADIAFGSLRAVYNCPANGCPASLFAYVPFAQGLVVAGGLLVLVSMVSFKGFRLAFLLGAALSLVILGLVAVEWGTYGSGSLPSAILSIAAAAVNAYASRGVKEISDQAHPLNLPVFG